jgi:arylsulfatase A-like enzyme
MSRGREPASKRRLLARIVVIGAVLGAVWLLVGAARARVPPPPLPIPHTWTPPLDGAAGLARAREQAAGANAVICVLDAARADHLGCYGYPRDTTPTIDRLAEESVVFDRHFCQHTQTKGSIASLFLSQYPHTHGALRHRRPPRDAFSIEQGFQQAGYTTALFASNMWVSPVRGMGLGFDWVVAPGVDARSLGPAPGMQLGILGSARGDEPPGESLNNRGPEALLARIARWLEEKPSGPFFAFVHFLPPHLPYAAPDELARAFAGERPPTWWRGRFPFREVRDANTAGDHARPGPDLVNRYDANLLWADRVVGELVGLLRRAGVLDHTLLIITADHGETFGEHGFKWHPACPYDETIRVPLLLRFPGDERPAGRVAALTESIDLLPTIYELLGLSYPTESVQGRSLLPLLTGEQRAVRSYAFSLTEGDPPCAVIRGERYSLLLFEGGKLRALYDTEADPWQTRNIADEQEDQVQRMLQAFEEYARAQRYPPLQYLDPEAPSLLPDAPPEEPLSPEVREELEALGYLK